MRKLNEIMTRDVKVVDPQAALTEVARMMDDLNIGNVLVCDGDQVKGIITDRDIVVRSISAGQDPNQVKVREIMTEPIEFCYEDQSLDEAVSLMKAKQIRRLPIVDRNKKLVGVVSLGDLAVDSKDKDLSGEVLQKVSEPAKPAA